MEQINLNIIPDGVMPVCHASQFDRDRTIRFNLTENGAAYTLAGTETIKCKIKKPDNTENVIDVTNTSSTYVEVVFGYDDLDVSGDAMCELVVIDGSDISGSRNFLLRIEADAYDGSVFEERSASGAIASFETNFIDNLTECIVDIDAVQAGSGTPSPSNPRAISGWSECNIHKSGINLWDEVWEVGSINDSGINAIDANKIRSKNYIPIIPNTDYFIVCPSATKNGKAFFYDNNQTFISSAWFYGNATTTTPSNACYMRFRMVDAYGTTYNNDISINYPSTDTSYHAHDGGVDTIEFGQTIFGGKLNVLTGLMTVTHAVADLGNVVWAYDDGNQLFSTIEIKGIENGAHFECSIYKDAGVISVTQLANYNGTLRPNALYIKNTDYNDSSIFKTAMAGQKIVYEISEPQTIQLTPVEVKTLLNANNIFADTGDIEVKYLIEVI